MAYRVKLLAKNYRCFENEAQGFNDIFPINIIIGKNNSGKSALLDLIKYATTRSRIPNDHKRKDSQPLVFYKSIIDIETVTNVFPDNTGSGLLSGQNDRGFGVSMVGSEAAFQIIEEGRLKLLSIEPEPSAPLAKWDRYASVLTEKTPFLFDKKYYRKISAERDVVRESETGNAGVEPNGNGATRLVNEIVHLKQYDRDVVEKNLLDALNEIVNPDLNILRITSKKDPEGKWEIYLDDDHNDQIALSNSGSGFKTILLVLINLIVIPYVEKQPKNKYIFAFEELENNLHPSVQRRLLRYLSKYVSETSCLLFLTTHSNVFIDAYANNEDAQILHVTKEGGCSYVKQIESHYDKTGLLDDLDYRASDLLQANGVIWVEGPSDRVLLNKWIEIESKGKLRESEHYQIMFYGGRLLSNLSLAPDYQKELVSVLKINKNVAIIIDSDKKTSRSRINKTKKRIIEELSDVSGFEWVTKGTEIENYLPSDAIMAVVGEKTGFEVPEFGSVYDSVEKYWKGVGEKHRRNKVGFLRDVSHHLDASSLNILDLSKKINALCKTIENWNNIAT